MKKIIVAVVLAVVAACGPDQEGFATVSADQFVGKDRTELIQYIRSFTGLPPCADFDNPIEKKGALLYAALPSTDLLTGQIAPRCSEFVAGRFVCHTDLGFEVAGRKITDCVFTVGPFVGSL